MTTDRGSSSPPRRPSSIPPTQRTAYVCDVSNWPLVVISAPSGCDPDTLDPSSFYRHTDRLLDHGEPFALLYDLRHSGQLSADRRKRFVDYVEQRREAVDRTLVAYASLVATDWQRGLLTAVLWFLTPPRPHRVFSSEVDARLWLREALDQAGVVRAG